MQPCTELKGDLGDMLDQLGSEGVVQLLVEGGATVAGEFHRAGLVDRYVLYLAPALFGGDDARGVFSGAGALDIADVWRGRFISVERVGADLRIELAADRPAMRAAGDAAPMPAQRSAEVFTGIVEELGQVESLSGPRLRIAASEVLQDVQLGASIAVNGCCLTVVEWSR